LALEKEWQCLSCHPGESLRRPIRRFTPGTNQRYNSRVKNLKICSAPLGTPWNRSCTGSLEEVAATSEAQLVGVQQQAVHQKEPDGDVSPIQLRPVLSKSDKSRLIEIAREIENLHPAVQLTRIREARGHVSNRRKRLRAVLSIVEDLLRHAYELEVVQGHIQVVPERARTEHGRVAKDRQRSLLLRERVAQLRQPSVQAFLNEMERPRSHEGRLVSVLDLIASGTELAVQLRAEGSVPFKPVLELADGNHVDPWTGLRLRDVWRYFRHTWALPYHGSPGRNIQFLIRDESLPARPVMGLLGFGNSLIQITARDDKIGWTLQAFTKRFQRRHATMTAMIESRPEWNAGRREVQLTRFLETAEEHAARIKADGARVLPVLRKAILNAMRAINKKGLLPRGRHSAEEKLRLLEITIRRAASAERRRSKNPRRAKTWKAESETPLFRKKRAKIYWKLVRAQALFDSLLHLRIEEQLRRLTRTPEGQFGLVTALQELKKEKVGTCMMDITICGAVPPYNHVLGGKLAAMIAASPLVASAYQRKYSGAISEIASAMKGAPVRRPARLVYLGTTSLYESHSVQYDRVQVPTPTGSIRFKELGRTAGFTSVHFSEETQELLEQISVRRDGRRKDTYKFGEGVNPKLRKISHGLRTLGLPERRITQYWSRRIVYGISLGANAFEYLRGEVRRPENPWKGADPKQTTDAIIDHWRARWLKPRRTNPGVLDALEKFSRDALVRELHPSL
jgi:hypothetical protein